MNGKHPPGITASNRVSGRWQASLISRATYDQTFSPFPRLANRATLRLFLACLSLSACLSLPAYSTSATGDDVIMDKRAAERGDAAAQFGLGVMYERGYGVTEDDTEAVRWYRMAAGQGYAKAQSNLGVMYDNGEGVPEDDTEAVRWYRMVAEQAQTFIAGQSVYCNDAHGLPVALVPDPQLDNVGRAWVAPNGAPVISLNPHVLAMFPPAIQLFWYAHECSHHILGHTLRVPQPRDEMDADCRAIRGGRDQGWFRREDLHSMYDYFINNPGSPWGHLPGQQRLQHFANCFDS